MTHKSMKYGFFLALAGVILCGGCQSDPVPSGSEGSVTKLTLNAGLPEAEATKTALGAEESGSFDILWKAGDRISVNGALSNAVAAADNGKKQVDFTITASLSAPYKVLYPGTTSNNVISLPATQYYVADSFDPAAAAAYGTAVKNGNKYGAKLNNFCGYIRFALKGSATLSKIELNSLGSEVLYGNFTLATDAEGFTGAFTGGTPGTLNYSFGSGLTLKSTDTYIYIALPAQAYAAGIEALVYQTDGAFMRLKFWGSGCELHSTDIIGFQSKTYAAGRTENLFGIDGLDAEDGGEPTAAPPGITVATFNVYQQSSRESSDRDYIYLTNEIVRTTLGKAIAETGADIIGFNELDSNFQNGNSYSIKRLAEAQGFTDYTWELDHPDDIEENGNWLTGYNYSTKNKYADGFAYKTSAFTVLDHNYVWISHKQDNKYYDDREDAYGNSGSPETTCAYAKFKHNVSGKQFYFFVTHTTTLDHAGSEVGAEKVNGKYDAEDPDIAARRLRIINNVKYFTSQKAGNLPYIVVGDFNFGPYIDTKKTKVQPLYTAMSNGGFVNAYDEVKAAGNLSGFYNNYPGTQTGCNWGAESFLTNGKYPQFRIDHIFLHDGSSQGITAQSYKTIRTAFDYNDGEKSVCPSDHLPVVSYITFD